METVAFKPKPMAFVLPYRHSIALAVYSHLRGGLDQGEALEAGAALSVGALRRREIAQDAAKTLGIGFRLSRRQETAVLYRYAAEHGLKLG